MNPKLKTFLMIVVKHAVNAVLTNAALMQMLSGAFNVHTAAGWWNMGKATLAVIGSREAIVWVPKIIKWTQTGTGNGGA